MRINEFCELFSSALHKGTTYEKIMNLRPRDKSLELDGQFRFKAKNNFEKFVEKVRVNATNSIKTDDIFSKHVTENRKTAIALKKNLEFIGSEYR